MPAARERERGETLLSRRRILGFVDARSGEWRELRDPDAPASARQLLRLNRAGALELAADEVEPISIGEASAAIDAAGERGAPERVPRVPVADLLADALREVPLPAMRLARAVHRGWEEVATTLRRDPRFAHSGRGRSSRWRLTAGAPDAPETNTGAQADEEAVPTLSALLGDLARRVEALEGRNGSETTT